MVDCWHGWATRSFSMKSQIFHITFSHHNLHLILVSFIWLSWTFIFHSVSHHLVIYSEREAHLLRFIVLTAWMFSVRAFQAGDAGIETWNLRQNHLKRSALLNRFPRLSLKSPPFFHSPIVVQTELHDWAWTLVSQILLVEKTDNRKNNCRCLFFFSSPTKTSLQMMRNRGEDEAFSVRAVLHNTRHTHFFFL